MRYRVLSVRTIAAWAVVIVLVGVGVAVWLLLAYTGGDANTNRAQLDAIRTAGTIVVGTGGAAALLLAARRQRTAEITLKQKDRDQVLQERVAAATEADAEARRITELYTRAVEQVGSEKAPVRLGGLYALERLAQDHIEQRQTIVNVLCAYLRMPYTLPGDPPTDDADDTLITTHRERVQEREVRLAAQRILAHHLRPEDNPDPVETFWADIDLDLTGATLINLDLSNCTTRAVQFLQATFTGPADFTRATFTGTADFDGVTFTGTADLNGATFTRYANFVRATFTRYANFHRATFTRYANFVRATFTGTADFNEATFTGTADFDGANLPSTRYAGPNTPSPWTDFAKAQFDQGAPPEVAGFVTPPPPAEGGNSLSTKQ